MRTVTSIAAGLIALIAFHAPAQAQFYGYRPYLPYYAYPYYPTPYGYYPSPYYYSPPPVVYLLPRVYRPGAMPRRYVAHHAIRRVLHLPAHRHTSRHLVNPLLGPLPVTSRRY